MSSVGCSPPWFANNYSRVCNRSLSQREVDTLGVDVFRCVHVT